MRLAPSILAIGVKAVIKTAGIPALSISFSNTAPQRVPVPQVEVRMTPETSASLRALAMSLPIFLLFSIKVATPVVV